MSDENDLLNKIHIKVEKISDEITLLNMIHAKIEKISEDISEVKIDQAVMKEDVKHHVKRSDMLEELFVDMKEKDIEPLKKDMTILKTIAKVLMAIGSAGLALYPILHHFLKN